MIEAYSRLDQILRGNNVTVSELHRRLREQGISANLKSLYRLANPNEPLERLDLRLAGAVCQTVGVQLGELITFLPPSEQLRYLPRVKDRRLSALMTKNNEGTITPSEYLELEGLVAEAEQITLANSRLLASQFKRTNSSSVT